MADTAGVEIRPRIGHKLGHVDIIGVAASACLPELHIGHELLAKAESFRKASIVGAAYVSEGAGRQKPCARIRHVFEVWTCVQVEVVVGG